MKILIIAAHDMISKALALNFTEHEVIFTSHDNALGTFLTEDPTHVVVWDYNEKLAEAKNSWIKGYETYHDIKNSAPVNLPIVRIDLEEYDYPDYLKAPFEIKELKALLGL